MRRTAWWTLPLLASALSLATFGCSAKTSVPAAAGADGGPLGAGVEDTLLTVKTMNGLAVDGRHLYWSDAFAGKLLRKPIAGGEPEELIGSAVDGAPTSVVLDDVHAWVGTDFDTDHFALRVDKTTKEILSDTGIRGCRSMVGSRELLFCTTATAGGIVRGQKATGTFEVLFDKGLSFADAFLAADEQQLLAVTTGGILVTFAHTGTTPVTVPTPSPLTALATRDGVGWLGMYDEATQRTALARLTGGAITDVASFDATTAGSLVSIAVDARHVYYALDGGSDAARIARVPVAGGLSEPVSAAKAPVELLLDDGGVYWVEARVGQVAVERRNKPR